MSHLLVEKTKIIRSFTYNLYHITLHRNERKIDKTDRHDIAEMLLKVALNTMTP